MSPRARKVPELPPDRVLVFVRAPRPGTVKRRLAAGLGEHGAKRAADIYRRLAERTFAALRPLEHDGAALQPLYAPADARKEIVRWLGSQMPLIAQSDGDLGARLEAGFRAAFASGAQRVAIVGTDCPGLEARHVREAFAALEDSDLVLGPARDGGYWLIAAKDATPPVFHGVPWASDAVLERTEALANAQGLRVTRLERLSDVDTVEDLDYLDV